MAMCYKILKKGASNCWAYRELKLSVAKREKIAKIGRGSLSFILCFFF